MNVALNNEVAPGVLGNLFAAYQSAKLNSSSSYDCYLQVAKEFLKGIDDKTRDEILTSEYNIGEILHLNDTNNLEEFDVILGFDNLISTIKNEIKNYQPKFLNFDGLKRNYTPPLEVFKYVGHNELDITKSSIGYSLLF